MCRGQKLHPQWEANGVRDIRQKRTFFGTIWKPIRRRVRRIAIFSAGQQTSIKGPKDYPNLIASSFDGYRKHFGRRECSRKVRLDGRGLAARFAHSQPSASQWNSNNTLVVSVHDLQFNHMYTAEAKRKVLRSFYDWLSDHVDWNNVEFVYLAGSSRGGCFSMRLGQHIMGQRATRSDTRFILQSVDGVCRKAQGEFGTHGTAFDNPIAKERNYRVFPTDIRRQFPAQRLRNICAFHIAGGEEVTQWGLRVHAFSDKSARGNKNDVILRQGSHVFYRQVWSKYAHQSLGQNPMLEPNSVNLLWDHYQTCMQAWGVR